MSGRDGYESSDLPASELPTPPVGPAPGGAAKMLSQKTAMSVEDATQVLARFVSNQPGTMGLIGRTLDFSKEIIEGPLSDINVVLGLPGVAPLIEVIRAQHDLIDQTRLLLHFPLVGAPDSEIVRERMADAQIRLGRARMDLAVLTDIHAVEDTPR